MSGAISKISDIIEKISILGLRSTDFIRMGNTGLDYIRLTSQKNEITKIRFVDDKSNHMFLRVDEGESNIDSFELN